MLYDIRSLISPTLNDGGDCPSWVFSLPFGGKLVSRLFGAWHIMTGKALAVSFPFDPITPDDVIYISHHIGMHDRKHSNYAHTECADCFWYAYDRYREECMALLEEFDSTQTIPFLDYMNQLVDDPNSNLTQKWLIMNEHVLYQVGDFLGFDHRSGGHLHEKFKELEVKYEMIRTRFDKTK